MIAFKKTATLCGMLVALALCGISSSLADPASEVAAIHAVDQVWVKAYNAGDVATVASLHDEHAVLLPPGAPAAHGRAAIRAFLAKGWLRPRRTVLPSLSAPNPTAVSPVTWAGRRAATR